MKPRRNLARCRLGGGALLWLAFGSIALAQQPACTSTTLSPPGVTLGGGSATGTIQVAGVTPPDCRWTAASNSPWITISFGTSGVLGGTVGYAVTANPSVNQRVGSITVSGTVFQVTQAGASCTATVSPSSATIAAAGGTGSFNVITPQGCAWTPASNAPWVTITSGSGSGNGVVQYNVAPNNSPSIRFAAITVGTATFNLTQSGFSCSYSVSPSSATVAASGGGGSFTVNAADTCSWTAVSNNPEWLSVTSGASGSGTRTVSFSALANTGAGSRTGTISVNNATFTVTQSATCTISLNPTQRTVTAAATTGTIRVTANLNTCERQASSDSSWLVITSGATDIGSGDIGYRVDANPTGTARVGVITVGNQTFTLNQLGSNCTITLTPNVIAMTNAGGQARVEVASNCSWTVTNNVNWILVTATSGTTGNGSVTFNIARNPDPESRHTTIVIGGASLVVRQDGTPQPTTCTYSISPASASVPASGGSGTIIVSAGEGCGWSASTATPWITIAAGGSGSGNGEVSYSAAANTSAAQRTGTVTIAGQTFTLVQEGTQCTYSISPRSASFPSSGGNGEVRVSSPCSWSASANQNWITITGGSPGTGDGVVSYTVAANSSAQPRTGMMTIAGMTFSISQTGVACSVTLGKTSATLGAAGGSGSFGVSGTSGCEWSATTGAAWLQVTWAAVGGAGTVYYTAEPNPGPGPRTAEINVFGQTFTLTQEWGPVVAAGGVVNAASFARGPVAPGLIVTIFGTSMGPAEPALLQLTPDQSAITTELAGTRVLFDDTPAPVIYTSASQVSAIVPYSAAGKTATRMTVEYNGVKSNAVQLQVAAASPAIFTLDASGTGQGAILNQNGSVNSRTNPALRSRNEVIQIFATGEGETEPPGADGRLMPADALARPTLPVAVRIGNVDATVTYAGSAPGLAAGVLQVNARIPGNAPLGDAVPITLSVGGVESQSGVTLAIR